MERTKEKATNNIVLPGDKIAVIEEYIPEENCYEDEGVIYSKVIGTLKIDSKRLRINVIPNRKIEAPKIGDIGIGRVEYSRKQIASISIFYLNDKKLPDPISGSLHISEVSKRYVRTMYEVARPGDWIRFKVIKVNNSIYLSFVGRNLGVLLAFCNQCGTELEYKKRNFLKCPNCDFEQSRITAKSYGTFDMKQ